jgi:hypothetical protein
VHKGSPQSVVSERGGSLFPRRYEEAAGAVFFLAKAPTVSVSKRIDNPFSLRAPVNVLQTVYKWFKR